MEAADAEAFRARLKGTFHGVLQWRQLDLLWERVKGGEWFVYKVGEALPEMPLSGGMLAERIDALDTMLRHDHDYDYCGIVYVDDAEKPTLVKVYDPRQPRLRLQPQYRAHAAALHPQHRAASLR